jgi:Uma2 family endonuclease
LLVEALYESWTPPPLDADNEADAETTSEPAAPARRPFWAASNVGIFRSVYLPGIAPDVFLSVDVAPPEDREIRSYFMWEHGKAPEVVLEIVSNRKGNETGSKLKEYAQMGVTYYVVYDPFSALHTELGGDVVRVYEVGFGKRFRRRDDWHLPELGLALTFWEGEMEGRRDEWLRWCDAEGRLLLTGHERAAQAEDRAAQAEDRAAQAENRAAQLAAKLRALGVDPEQV